MGAQESAGGALCLVRAEQRLDKFYFQHDNSFTSHTIQWSLEHHDHNQYSMPKFIINIYNVMYCRLSRQTTVQLHVKLTLL